MTRSESRSNDLEDTFFQYGTATNEYMLKLTLTSLIINQKLKSNEYRLLQEIPIDDIYGCLCIKSTGSSSQCHLKFYLYSVKSPNGISSFFSNKKKLDRMGYMYTYGKYNDCERNMAEIVRWHRHVTEAVYLRRNLPIDIVTTKRDKRVIVFVNPAGGAGKAYRLVMAYAVGAWSEAEFNHQIIVTEYAGHARDYVQGLELNECGGIVVASGDGLVYEVLNGLLSRNDWQEAIQLPIGHLPCGSGNAFIANIIRHSKQPVADSEERFVVQAAIMVATHNVIPFDMAVIDLCDGQRVFSFLTIEWGIIADVDFQSEKYRFLGDTRFTVEAAKQIARPRCYYGYIDYLPYDAADDTIQTNPVTSNTTTAQLHQHLLPFNQPVPIDSTTSKWRRVNGPFANVLVTSKSAISKDAIATPSSTLADGFLTLQYILSESATRMNLFKAFTSLSDGNHFSYDFVHWIAVRAFRIVPSETDGTLMVDGERVPYGPIQGEILPNFARCMGKHPRSS